MKKKKIIIGISWKNYQNIQRADRPNIKSINYEVKKNVEELSINDRVEKMQENQAFITIKDYV